ncbi:MAG: 1-(5-phosphoribosyl)-5-[(5-phosphoribosylamino)methylideneamino]imidazole-4-carboxamide isomerase [Ruminococcaceae bacterium]|nr:1-(5-phosphoribosyl)-5-[(5-phosphoribosylamino)methylideneamino]imidazole-4-carboxamide isomerase [Oscillospiraceae bacterium]
MLIYPAIDLYNKKAVRLYKGDYNQMTVYNDNPVDVAIDFKNSGATHIHLVDLEGAKSGTTPNFDVVKNIKKSTSLFCEIGGGIRSIDVIDKYISYGIDRVILGTAAVTNKGFVEEAVSMYSDKIAVGIDIKDGFVAIKGWTETSNINAFDFCKKMQNIGVKTIICTDISKDGAMQGTNHELYKDLSDKFDIQIIASGGVSSIDDIKKLRQLDIHGAIVGKAYYTGSINLSHAIEVAK